MKRGIQRLAPLSINWAVTIRRGAPSTADVPGGRGSAFEAAKSRITAP
jgi:hypothetical protein